MLLVNLRDLPVGTRQPNGELIAEPEGRVVPAVEFDPRNEQVRPLRELPLEQPGHERRRDGRLVQAAISCPMASYLRIEERELEAGGLNQPPAERASSSIASTHARAAASTSSGRAGSSERAPQERGCLGASGTSPGTRSLFRTEDPASSPRPPISSSLVTSPVLSPPAGEGVERKHHLMCV